MKLWQKESTRERETEREEDGKKVSLFLGLDKFGVPKSMLRKCEKIHRVMERGRRGERGKKMDVVAAVVVAVSN